MVGSKAGGLPPCVEPVSVSSRKSISGKGACVFVCFCIVFTASHDIFNRQSLNRNIGLVLSSSSLKPWCPHTFHFTDLEAYACSEVTWRAKALALSLKLQPTEWLRRQNTGNKNNISSYHSVSDEDCTFAPLIPEHFGRMNPSCRKLIKLAGERAATNQRT